MFDFVLKHMPAQKWKKLGGTVNVKPTWNRAFEKLKVELAKIGATGIVIECGYQPSQIRNDGLPYADAKPEHGQARVSFHRHGKVPTSFFCGAWAQLHFNVYMIAMTLERLRAIKRYACTQGEQQYAGWSQLPPGREPIAGREWTSADKARRWMGELCGLPAETDLTTLFREAAKVAHPDRGGSDEQMAKVGRARDFVLFIMAGGAR